MSAVMFDDHANGRIYYQVVRRTSRNMDRPAWSENHFFQWDDEHGKYGLYQYAPSKPFGVGELQITHDRVGAEPRFEDALNWLIGMSDSSRRSR
jgi:hypothetical protein